MKSKVVMAPPGSFWPADINCRKHWRRTQHTVNEFWARWRKEFIHTLKQRKLCRKKRRNFQMGDVVFLKPESSWNDWPTVRIIETFSDKYGILWTIKLRRGDAVGLDQRELVRPIMKTLLLVESDSPTESEECWEPCKITK